MHVCWKKAVNIHRLRRWLYRCACRCFLRSDTCEGDCYLLPVKCQLILYVFRYLFCILSYCIYIVPLHQKLGFPYLNFRFPCLSCIRVLLFPFRNPINPDTLSFGGISTSMWIWSGPPSASMIFTPFHLHRSRSIFPISPLCSPQNIFLLYFGANTIWYL